MSHLFRRRTSAAAASTDADPASALLRPSLGQRRWPGGGGDGGGSSPKASRKLIKEPSGSARPSFSVEIDDWGGDGEEGGGGWGMGKELLTLWAKLAVHGRRRK